MMAEIVDESGRNRDLTTGPKPGVSLWLIKRADGECHANGHFTGSTGRRNMQPACTLVAWALYPCEVSG